MKSQHPENEMYVFRAKRNLSAKECARLLGISWHTVKAIESGRLKLPPRLSILMEHFGASARDKEALKQMIDAKAEEYRAKLYKDAGI